MTKPKKSAAELKAMAFTLADEIETKALPLIKAGKSRVAAINQVLAEMAK